MAKHRAKVEKRQLQEAIDAGMVKAKGLGKKMRKEKLKGARCAAACGLLRLPAAAWLLKWLVAGSRRQRQLLKPG
jgi:hypothetical protein